ncbi:MAG: hypothetical protein M3Z33_04860 [Actinomycetota bacterium]|nr:hypothetical protein [Actinomycetota bacterium]
MIQPLARNSEKTSIARDPHDRLSDAKRDDLRVCDPATGVAPALRQEIVGRAINGSAESVEVGVHVASWSTVPMDTADFGLSAENPLITAFAVESTI